MLWCCPGIKQSVASRTRKLYKGIDMSLKARACKKKGVMHFLLGLAAR